MPEREAIPKDKLNIRLLLVDGKSHDFVFSPETSGSEIAHYVYHNWPSDWDDASLKPDRADVLKLIYRGRFLHETTTLSSLSLPLGKTTILHLIMREKLPDQQQSDISSTRVKVATQEHSRCCTIL